MGHHQARVAIITPSRGLIFAEVLEYIENVRDNYANIRCYFSHNLPIPDCLNALVEQALADPNVNYLWFIEDDTIPPDRALDALFALDAPVAAIDYGFNGGSNTVVRSEKTGEILFTGFGCTLVKREVFGKLEKPYFRADKAYNISALAWQPVDPYKVYGHHDIEFFSKVRHAGFTIKQVDSMECRHLQLLQLGQKEINNGCHTIGEKDRISRRLTLPVGDI